MGLFNKQNDEVKVAREMMKSESNDRIVTTSLESKPSIEEERLAERREVLVELTRWQQDRTPAHLNLFYNLSGLMPDKQGGLMESKWNVGYCSKLGARKLMDFVDVIDKNNMLGSYGEDDVNRALKVGIGMPLISHMVKNHNELGITLNHASYIMNMIINSEEGTYRRGLNNGERRMVQETIKVNEVRQPSKEEPQRKFLGLNVG